MGRKGKGNQGRGGSGTPARGTRATDSRTRPTESSARQVDESKKKDINSRDGKQSKQDATTGDQKGKITDKDKTTDKVESEGPSTEKQTLDKNLKEFKESTDSPTGENKVTTKMELRSKGKQASCESIPGLLKLDTASAVGFENAASQTRLEAHLCIAAPIQADTKLVPLSELLQGSKVKGTIPMLECSEDAEKPKCDTDNLKESDVQHQELSSGNGRNLIETKTEEDESISSVKCSEGTGKSIGESDNLKDSEVQPQEFSRNEENFIEIKTEEKESVPMLKCPEDADKLKGNSDISKSSEIEQGLPSETEILVTKPNPDKNEFLSLHQNSTDIDERKLCMDQNSSQIQLEIASENQRKNTEPKLEVNESTPVLQVPERMDIDEIARNLDLNVLNFLLNRSSENWNKLSDPNAEELEETIHLKKNVNLRFEFDNLGNKKISVNDKISYVLNEKQKMKFDIGEGYAQLSFLGNNVSIFTQESKIDCSLQKNQIIFAIPNKTAEFNSESEDLHASRISESNDITIVKELSSTNVTGAVEHDTVTPTDIVKELCSLDIAGAVEHETVTSIETIKELSSSNIAGSVEDIITPTEIVKELSSLDIAGAVEHEIVTPTETIKELSSSNVAGSVEHDTVTPTDIVKELSSLDIAGAVEYDTVTPTSIVKEIRSTNVVGAVGDVTVTPTEICPKNGSENAYKPMPEIVPSTAEPFVSENLPNMMENFLTSVKTACENFENNFLKSLKGRSEDKPKK